MSPITLGSKTMEHKIKRKGGRPRKVVQPKPTTEEKIVENQETAIQGENKVSMPATLAEFNQVAAVEAIIDRPQPAKSAARRERVPLGRTRLKLTAPKRPGFHRHWINDVGGRLEEAENGSYYFVTGNGLKVGETAIGSGNQDLGSRVSRIVGTKADGTPMRAYLMEIEEEYYQQDQREKQERLDKIDEQIKGGTFNPESDNDTKRYVPTEGISIK